MTQIESTGAIAFNNLKNLETAPLVSLDIDENGDTLTMRHADGNEIPRALAWTGTALGGTVATSTCDDWTAVEGATGVTGTSDAGQRWTDDGSQDCGGLAHLYCIEQ